MDISEFVKNGPKERTCLVVSCEELMQFLEKQVEEFAPKNIAFKFYNNKEILLGNIPCYASWEDVDYAPVVFSYRFNADVEYEMDGCISLRVYFERPAYGKKGEFEKVEIAEIKLSDDDDDSYRAMAKYAVELYLSYNNIFWWG